MARVKLSVCIPYKARLDNLAIALEALARQTMSAAEFEVIIGAMEYSTELIALCSDFRDRLNLVTVCSSREFHIPWARNLAMRNVTGEVVVQMDADTMLAPEALQRLWDHCFAFGQRVCAVGQVVGLRQQLRWRHRRGRAAAVRGSSGGACGDGRRRRAGRPTLGSASSTTFRGRSRGPG